MALSKTTGSVTSYRRRKQIKDCLFQNLLQRPYTSVSVSDLCHQLEISRKSFYNYFPDKDSCFRAIISRKLRQCSLAIAASSRDGADPDTVIAVFLTFWMEERSFLDIIVHNDLLTMYFEQCVHFIREEDKILLDYLNTPQLETDEYVLACYVNINITIIVLWYKSGFEIPLEDMVCKYKRMAYAPLLSLSCKEK